jgi:methionyl-tRNA synthetase
MEVIIKEFKRPRPEFPKRAVITAGMPYGNKSLHFGHIGGVFIHADTYARFLKDRIGKENVIFVSGTDCYGSPIVASHKKYIDETGENISMEDYVHRFHMLQKNILADYDVQPSLYASSAFERSGEVHKEVSKKLFNTLYEGGFIKKLTTKQFYDPKAEEFLNGRQVIGKCPFEGCKSEKAYADECSLGHQYQPRELIDPISIISGEKPELRDVSNWYFILEEYTEMLQKLVDIQRKERKVRPMVLSITNEYLKAPAIYVTRKEQAKIVARDIKLEDCKLIDEPKKPSVTYEFESLETRNVGQAVLEAAEIRFRTGKTLVPFRLSGNCDWGVPVPNQGDLNDLTFWVWPESLWAPISFTQTYLESIGKDPDEWDKWWTAEDAKVFQFIGEDNIYFYGIAETGMLLAYLGHKPTDDPDLTKINFPQLVSNYHLLFLDTKASSSGSVKPPMADELLNYYTKDQLRMHFLSLGLSKKSVSFNPKPFDPNAKENEADPTLKDGNLLTNVLNRLLRSCFYTAQKHTDSVVPKKEVSDNIKKLVEKSVLDYESIMAKQEFHRVISILDKYIRTLSKHWSKEMNVAFANEDQAQIEQIIADTLYGVKVALTLLHPVVPESSEYARNLLNLNETLWSWDYIFDPITKHMDNPETHKLTFIEARFDFFKKHESQFADK